MAIRNIRTEGDPILRKKSKTIEKFDQKLHNLLDDMADTMYGSNLGVGLAAPQIGILKRAVIFDIGDGLYEFINPEIIEKDGSFIEVEGCLSIPEVYGEVERPSYVKIRYFDRNGNECFIEAEDYLSVVINHEIDHLEGVLFIDKVIRYIDPKEYYKENIEDEE